MKTCERISTLIKRSMNDQLTTEQLQTVENHIKNCDSCEMEFRRVESVKNLLFSQKSEKTEAPSDLIPGIHMKLVEESHKKRKSRTTPYKALLYMLIPSAMALLFLLFFPFERERVIEKKDIEIAQVARKEKSIPISSTTANSDEPIVVQLSYFTAEKIDRVTFSIDLEDEISFVSKNPDIGKLKHHSWKGSLKKGENKITFVISLNGKNAQSVMTKAEYMGVVHRHRVELSPDNGKIRVTYYEIKDASDKTL